MYRSNIIDISLNISSNNYLKFIIYAGQSKVPFNQEGLSSPLKYDCKYNRRIFDYAMSKFIDTTLTL